MTQSFASLEQMSACCAIDLGIGTAEPGHPAFCRGDDWPGACGEQRRVIDMVCGQGVAYLNTKRPDRSQRAEERFLRRVKRRSEKITRERDVDKTGFAPLILIGGAIVGWLIQKALDWLLRWWRSAPQATECVAAMCVGLPGMNWLDDEELG